MHALVLAALLAVPQPLSPSVRRADSRIDAVTAHRGSARVTRVARLELPAGPSRVLLDGLPAELADDSLRVEGRGAGKARIHGISVERVTAEQALAAEARAAEEALLALQDEDRALEDRVRVAEGRRKFVESLRSTYADERARNLAVRGVSAREWADLTRFVDGELSGASAEVRRAEVARRTLARRIQAASEARERVRAKLGADSKAVAVEVEAEEAGALELAVSYTVPSAGWQPIWDARLSPEKGSLELSLLAAVVNRSGEDWRQVKLSVSTAQPGRGLFVPVLEPRWLARRELLPMASDALRRAVPASAPAPAKLAFAREKAAGAMEEQKVEAVAELVQADVAEGMLAATFTAPRRETVDGAGQARRIALRRFSLPAEVGRTAAPRLDPAAFLTAAALNETGVPLLAGEASVYLGDEFVGRAPLAFTPPGGKLTLAFGADPRVEVERRVLERRHETAGLVSKDDVWVYRTRIAVKNRWGTPVALKLLDLVPVSREKEIEVTVLEGTSPAREDPERPGVRVHELALAPRQEQVVEIRYRVRFPRGTQVAGLE
ncbi:MAG: mucoidy inhibitor MuiA family protein [Deltaproteobacteria bacterium]|nr:mucoidy inhibitor MuiA family protein [Deltaproteobacteria bacterium]